MKTVNVMVVSALLLTGCSLPHGTKHYDAYVAEMQGDKHGYKPYDQSKADAMGDDFCESLADKPPLERRQLEQEKLYALFRGPHTGKDLDQNFYILNGYCTKEQLIDYGTIANNMLPTG